VLCPPIDRRLRFAMLIARDQQDIRDGRQLAGCKTVGAPLEEIVGKEVAQETTCQRLSGVSSSRKGSAVRNTEVLPFYETRVLLIDTD